MIDPIVQEVREIRASIAEEFGFDRTRLIAWAREQTRQRKAIEKPNNPNRVAEATQTHRTSH